MNSTRRGSSRAIASLIATLLAVGGVIVAPVAAVAVEAPSTGATLDWDIKTQFSTYVLGPIASGSITASGNATASGTDFSWSSGTGVGDSAAATADIDFTGGIRFQGHSGALDLTVSNPNIVVTSATTGAIYADVTSVGGFGFPATDATMKVADLTFDALTVTATAISGTSVTQTLTAEAKAVFAGLYTDADPVTFSIPIEQVATETTTTIAVSPAQPVAGDDLTLTATVSPEAAGTVQFFSASGVVIGAPQAVVAGQAVLVTDELAAGDYTFSAVFTPDDTAAFTGSTSDEVAVTITAPASAVATTTTVATSPAAPVVLGSTTTITATVTAADSSQPAGSVAFYDIAAGTSTRVLLGTAAVTASTGIASLGVELTAGGHTVAAVYTPADVAAHLASEAATTANYGVVDPSAPSACVPGSSAVTVADAATVTWAWSAYAGSWAKTATGDATVSGGTFVLTGGDLTADAECAVIAFTGTLQVTAYGTEWTRLVDPVLTVQADGSGVWTAGVSTGTGGVDNTTVSSPVVVAAFDATSGVGPGVDVDADLTPRFAGTTALGTWSAAYDSAWPNAFILQVHPGQRAFYYVSGTSPAQANKPASALSVEFAWPAVTSLALAASPTSPQVAGTPVTFTATVQPSTATGTVEFFETPTGGTERSLGAVAVTDGVAAITLTDLAGSGHAVRAAFSSESFEASAASLASAFRVVDTSTASLCTIDEDAEQLTGVEIDWDWNAYSSGWTKVATGDAVSVDGQTFQFTDGVVTLGDDCTIVSLTGAIRVEAYAAYFPTNGQWVELVDPELVLDGDGNGAWVAGVRSGVGVYAATTTVRTVVAEITGATVPDFSGDAAAAVIALDYEDTTAAGTWPPSTGKPDGNTDAWSNGFVLQVPSAVRSFYYASGANADGNKAPADLQLRWNLADPTATANVTEVEQGGQIVFTGTGFRAGDTVAGTVHSDPVDLGTTTASLFGVASFTWTVPTGFAVGAHTAVLETPDGRSATVQFTVTAGESAAAAVCTARAIDSGSLTWGVRSSFRSYVLGGIANGSITFLGASTTASQYTWTGATGSINTEASVGRASWTGSLVYRGHGGLLDLRLSNPRIQITSATSAVVILDVVSSDSSGTVVVDGTVTFARIALPAGAIGTDAVTVSGASAWLTEAGASAFGGFYSAGDALDPISFSLALGGEVACDEYSDPELASTGSTGPSADLLWVGGLLIALGTGVVVLRRRRRVA